MERTLWSRPKHAQQPHELLFVSVRGSLRRLRPFGRRYEDRIHVPCSDDNRIRLYQGHPQPNSPTANLMATRSQGQIVVDLSDFRRDTDHTSLSLATPAFPPNHRPLPDTQAYDGFRVTFTQDSLPVLQGLVGVVPVDLPGISAGHHNEFASSVEYGLSIHAGERGWSFFDNV